MAMKPAAPSTPASRGMSTPKRFERASWAAEPPSVRDTLSNNLASSVGLEEAIIAQMRFCCVGLGAAVLGQFAEC